MLGRQLEPWQLSPRPKRCRIRSSTSGRNRARACHIRDSQPKRLSGYSGQRAESLRGGLGSIPAGHRAGSPEGWHRPMRSLWFGRCTRAPPQARRCVPFRARPPAQASRAPQPMASPQTCRAPWHAPHTRAARPPAPR
eukprot:2074251-Prymnesium_polylepis.2